MFGMPVVCYLFLSGCAAGLLLACSVSSLAFHRGHSRSAAATLAFSDVKARCSVVGFVVLAVAAVCLVGDLGRPDRALNVFIRPTWSIMAFGTYVLSTMLAVGGLQAMVYLFGYSWATGRVRCVLEVCCAVLALPLMLYTGLFLQGMRAVALWDTVFLPVLFVVSALSTGLALFFVVASFSTSNLEGTERIMRALHIAHVAALCTEVVALAGFVVHGLTDNSALPAARRLLGAQIGPWLGFAAAAGIAIPLATGAWGLVGPARHGLPLADILCLLGGFALRYCIVAAGIH